MPNDRTNVLRTWFEEVWNKAREEAIDELAAADMVAHGLLDADGNEITGRDKFKIFWRQFRGAFPDLRVEVNDEIMEGDKVMVRCTARGTHTGEGLGAPPSKKAIHFTGMVIARIANGQLQEAWDNWDFLSLYQQMGVLPVPSAK